MSSSGHGNHGKTATRGPSWVNGEHDPVQLQTERNEHSGCVLSNLVMLNKLVMGGWGVDFTPEPSNPEPSTQTRVEMGKKMKPLSQS